MPSPKQTPIAVVGVSALFPGSVDKDGFWRDILSGRDLMTDVPPSHWLIEDYFDADPSARDKTYARRGAFLPEVDFDPIAWGVPPSIVPATDTTQLLALIVAQQVLEDACGGQFKDLSRDRASVILGVTSAQELLGSMVSRLQRPVWVKSLRELGLPESKVTAAVERISSHYVEWQESTFPGVLGNVVAGRIANRLDLGGTNCVTDAACASSFSALAMAVGELRLGQSDLVITGGADTMNDIFMYLCFSKTPALSASGDCRPFSDRADGTMLGEGIGMVALKRLDDAEQAGDRIYAVIKGVGSGSDGRSKSVYAPVPAGQAKALRRAYEQAGHGPETVELVEAHGTGTQAGDAAEVAALRTVFDESGRSDRGWCALGSVKSQIGHTKAAAGAAGLFKAVMALHHKVLPPTIKVDRPDPKLSLPESPFYLNTVARPWIRGARPPRRASVSAFGFGGSNFHVALEEYTGDAARPPRIRPSDGEVLLFAGESAEAIATTCRAIAVGPLPQGTLAFLARSLQESFAPSAAARLSVFVGTEEDLGPRLRKAAELCAAGQPFASPEGIELALGEPLGEVAFLFPGQGSQYLHMGSGLAMGLEVAQRAWDRACSLELAPGERLEDVVFPRPVFTADERGQQQARLTATQWAQPALGAASLALLETLREAGVHPSATAGHSFGEVSALHAAGVISAEDLIRIGRRRGELMADASRTPGAMTAVSARAEELLPKLEAWNTGVVVANHNTPQQLVLAGSVEAVRDVEERLAALGISATRLNVSTAFHSPLVSAAAAPLRELLETIELHPPQVDVLSNTTAAPYPREPAAIRDLLARQLAEPVRFVEQIEALYARGVRVFVEVGPGRVLTGLVGHILKKRPHRAVALDRSGVSAMRSLSAGLGQLSVAGVPVAYQRLWSGFARTDDPRSRKKAALTLKLNGASYGKPYPPPGGAAALPPPNPEPVPTAAPSPGDLTMPPSDPSLALAWMQAFQESQRQTAEAHAAFSKAMTDSHAAFLRASEASLQSLAAMLGQPLPAESLAAPQLPPAVVQPVAPPPPPAPSPLPMPAAPKVAKPVAPVVAAPMPVAPQSQPASPAVAALSSEALSALLLEVVAEKTGYPKEMLGLDMDLEADLGVDSIKRVQILAAALERSPGLPEIGASQMASMRTLGEIASFLSRQVGGGADKVAASPSAAAPPSLLPRAREIERLSVQAVQAPAMGFGAPDLTEGRLCAVTDDGAGVGMAVVARLEAAGVQAQLVSTIPTDPDLRALVLLEGLRSTDGLDAAVAAQRSAFQATRAVASRFAKQGGTLITVQETGGDFGLAGSDRAWNAGYAALARTAAAEWPNAHVRALDLERGGRSAELLAEAIVQELLAGGLEREVALKADGTRWALQARPAPAHAAQPSRLDADSVVVASGGARGVTAQCLLSLAREAKCRFLLLGRTPLEGTLDLDETSEGLKRRFLSEAQQRGEKLTPAELGRRIDELEARREVQRTLASFAALGSTVRYVALDVTDASAVAAAVEQARSEWGPITAVVHGAGVLADKRIEDKNDAQWDRVFGTKVLGLHALLEATRADALEHLVLFSSVAATWGNPGQCDYAMANEVLNRVAATEQRRRGPRCRVRAIGWGPWDGGMVDAALKDRFAASGVQVIPLEAGASAFVSELSLSANEPAVLLTCTSSLSAAAAGAEVTAALRVDRRTYPFLEGHRVKGTVVVPVALCLEWFARLAKACRPELRVVALEEVQVLRGIRLAKFDAEGDLLTLRARTLPSDAGCRLSVELLSADGARHYSAVCRLEARALPPSSGLPEPTSLEPWAHALYDGTVLFHGPDFQVIELLKGVAAEGAEAQLKGLDPQRWPGAWMLDAALLDGGLQLALLWTFHRLGAAGLPTSIGALQLHSAGKVLGRVRCTLKAREAGKERTLCDLAFAAQDGTVLAELRGVEVHLLPRAAGRTVTGEVALPRAG